MNKFQEKVIFLCLQIEVVLKIFYDDLMFGAMISIMEEVRLMQRLDYECIVKLYGICEKLFMLVRVFLYFFYNLYKIVLMILVSID